jgi:putative transposase
VHWVQSQFGVSESRGCAALRFDRRTHRYRSVRPDQAQLRQRIKEIAEVRIVAIRQRPLLAPFAGWLHFSRPGKPKDNAFVESFNGRLRD